MSRPQLDKVVRPGDPYSAGEQNEIRREARRNRTVVPAGRAASQHAAGLFVQSPKIPRVYKAKADHGSISVGASGAVTLYEAIDSFTLTSRTLEPINSAPSAIPADAVCWVLVQDGKTVIQGWFC